MKKSNILRFISKYNLSTIEQVKLISSKKDRQLSTSFVSDDKSVLGKVLFKDFDSEDFQVGISETDRLKSLLSVLEEDIEISYKKEGDKITSLTLSDKTTNIDYVTCEECVIPKVPILSKIPVFDVELICDKDFITKFIKAKNALPESNTFAIVQDDSKLNIYLGYSSNNTNRVKLEVKGVSGKDKIPKTIHFSSKYFKEILVANSEVTEFKFYVSSKGLAKVEFEKDNFFSEYFFVEIKIED